MVSYNIQFYNKLHNYCTYYKFNIYEKVKNEINIKQELIDKDTEYLASQIEKIKAQRILINL